MDFLLIVLCLANPEMALFFALVTLIGSILGGIAGYKLGEYLGLPILKKMFSKKKIDIVHDYYEKYETLAVAIGGFTPLPYKLFAVSAGVFYIDFKKFIIVSSISRGARFFIVATLLMLYGVAIQNFIDKYFNIISIISIIILSLAYLIYNKRKK